MRAGIGDADLAVGGNHLGFEKARGGHAVVLRKSAEPASRQEPDDAHSATASALNISSAMRCDGVISLEPAGACSDRDGRSWRDLAARRNKCIVQLDGVHVTCPDEERVWSIGEAEIAMPATLENEAELVVAGEVDGGDDVSGILRGDGVDARR